jgi:hypothetical protein
MLPNVLMLGEARQGEDRARLLLLPLAAVVSDDEACERQRRRRRRRATAGDRKPQRRLLVVRLCPIALIGVGRRRPRQLGGAQARAGRREARACGVHRSSRRDKRSSSLFCARAGSRRNKVLVRVLGEDGEEEAPLS